VGIHLRLAKRTVEHSVKAQCLYFTPVSIAGCTLTVWYSRQDPSGDTSQTHNKDCWALVQSAVPIPPNQLLGAPNKLSHDRAVCDHSLVTHQLFTLRFRHPAPAGWVDDFLVQLHALLARELELLTLGDGGGGSWGGALRLFQHFLRVDVGVVQVMHIKSRLMMRGLVLHARVARTHIKVLMQGRALHEDVGEAFLKLRFSTAE